MAQQKDSFDSLSLPTPLQDGVDLLQFKHMTPVQTECLPLVLRGEDVAVRAKTGSGKTLAFSLGLLNRLQTERLDIQSLVLCPTRELAEQVAEQIRLVGKRLANLKVLTLCGGVPIKPQMKSLTFGAHVVVGTPGRIIDHISKRSIGFEDVNCLVLDEADRMLDMGFSDQVQLIMRELSANRLSLKLQTLLFSATFPDAISQLTSKYQRDTTIIEMDDEIINFDIEQSSYIVDEEHRNQALASVISEYKKQTCIVFCNMRHETETVTSFLNEKGFTAASLHGDLEQIQRSMVIARFNCQSINVLVATDVAARGLDMQSVDIVINHRLSDSADTHVHRVGRTGRAGEKGIAVTLLSEKESERLDSIASKTGSVINQRSIQALRFHANRIQQPEYSCIAIDGGKRDKLRAGDLMGALIKDAEIPSADIGKILITAKKTYVGIKIRSVKRTMLLFRESRIKGKRFKARRL